MTGNHRSLNRAAGCSISTHDIAASPIDADVIMANMGQPRVVQIDAPTRSPKNVAQR